MSIAIAIGHRCKAFAAAVVILFSPTANGTTLVQPQLKGICSVHLLVYVTGYAEVSTLNGIHEDVREAAALKFNAAGVATGTGKVFVSLTARAHPATVNGDEQFWVVAAIQVREPVQLARDKSIEVPPGAITWRQERFFLTNVNRVEADVRRALLDLSDELLDEISAASE